LIILILLDTGLRAAELLALDIEHINPIIGTLQVLHGKGNKFRLVYLGKKSRLELRSFLRRRRKKEGALLLGIHGERLAYAGLRLLLKGRG